MKYNILAYLLLFSVFNVYSQTKIEGTIKDDNGEPIFGVNISTDRQEGAVSDFDGKYILNVAHGTFNLTISSIGYQILKKKITIAENENQKLNFTLKEEQIEVEQTIVYGSKRGKTLQEEVQSVEIIKTEILENNNVTDGIEAVALLSGVTILDGQMSVRGGSGYAYGVGSRVVAVVDEVPVMTPERDEINWDFIPVENIDQMELIKGGGSVQYGSSALNGVLSVRSKWAKKKHETSVSLYNTFIGKPKIEGANWWKDEKSYIDIPHTLGLTFVHRRKMKNNVDISFNGMLHSFQSHLKDDFNERVRFNFNIRHRSEKFEGLSLGLYTMAMYRNDSFYFMWQGNGDKKYIPLATYGKRYNYNTIHPFIKYYDKKGNSFNYNGSVYYDFMSEEKPSNQSIKVYNDFQYKRKFKFKLNTIIGLTSENYFVKAPALRDIYFAEDEYGWFEGSKYAAYLLGDYKVAALSLSGGFRYEVIHLEEKILSSKPTFSLGLNYKLSKQDFFRLSFAQSFRLPSIAERYVDESLGPVNIYPNPEIRPETGYTSEIGYKRMLNNKKWKGFADLAIFWTEFDDMIEFHFGNFAEPEDTVLKLGFRAENVARARIFGWEFNFEETGKIGQFEIFTKLGYTYAYGVDLNKNKEAKNVFKTIGNAFKAIYVSDELHAEFESNTNKNRPDNPLYGILKYRYRHVLKLDLNIAYKRFSIGSNMAYYSFIDNVDNIFKLMIPGVSEDRDEQEFKGEFILNLRAAYLVKDKVSFAFILENALNNDYALRPGKPNAPRSYTFKTSFHF